MKRIVILIGVALAAILLMAMVVSPGIAARRGLVRTDYPSAEDPGMPFYARIEPAPPHFFADGEWAAVVFYRDPGCVPTDFNLLQFFDPPVAFGCPHVVQGFSLWQGERFVGAPWLSRSTGNGAVPVWFLPVDAASQAAEDGYLTVGELAGIEGRLVGSADHFKELIQPHPLPPELGGGGHPNPKLILRAKGTLEDGRQFQLHIQNVNEQVRTRIGIR